MFVLCWLVMIFLFLPVRKGSASACVSFLCLRNVIVVDCVSRARTVATLLLTRFETYVRKRDRTSHFTGSNQTHAQLL